MSLKAARELRDNARKLLAAGIDPAEKKKQDRYAAKISAANSFAAVAQSYIDKCKREGRSERTIDKQQWLLKLLERTIGQRPVAEIQPFEMLEAVRKYESSGRTEAARRAIQFASQVFRFAIANQLAASDPTRDLRGALTSHKAKHHAAILEPQKAGELLRAIHGYDGHPVTRFALQLAALLFVRPGELRYAEWSEFDFDANVWRIPAEKMKARAEHVVPVPRQAFSVLAETRALTGDGQYVFPSIRTQLRPMSENTVNAALRRLGYPQLIQIICPPLRHFYALVPVCPAMIGSAYSVSVLVGQSPLDGIRRPFAGFIEQSACHRSEAVTGHLVIRVGADVVPISAGQRR